MSLAELVLELVELRQPALQGGVGAEEVAEAEPVAALPCPRPWSCAPCATAGTKKKALNGSAARRSLVGTRPISPEILISADASREGWPIRMAPDRSAASSR